MSQTSSSGRQAGKTATSKAVEKAYTEGRNEGFDEGLQKGRQEILDWLQAAYISAPDRPERGTPKAEAILEMAHAASEHFHTKLKGRRR